MGNQQLVQSLTRDLVKEVDITQYGANRKKHQIAT